jgi:hypothetical protein
VRSCLDTGASGSAGKDNLDCTVRSELGFKTCPFFRVDSVTRLLDAAPSTSGHIDQDHRQPSPAKHCKQGLRAFDDLGERMEEG